MPVPCFCCTRVFEKLFDGGVIVEKTANEEIIVAILLIHQIFLYKPFVSKDTKYQRVEHLLFVYSLLLQLSLPPTKTSVVVRCKSRLPNATGFLFVGQSTSSLNNVCKPFPSSKCFGVSSFRKCLLWALFPSQHSSSSSPITSDTGESIHAVIHFPTYKLFSVGKYFFSACTFFLTR